MQFVVELYSTIVLTVAHMKNSLKIVNGLNEIDYVDRIVCLIIYSRP